MPKFTHRLPKDMPEALTAMLATVSIYKALLEDLADRGEPFDAEWFTAYRTRTIQETKGLIADAFPIETDARSVSYAVELVEGLLDVVSGKFGVRDLDR